MRESKGICVGAVGPQSLTRRVLPCSLWRCLQRYKKPADWGMVEQVAAQHSVPIIGNGDILTHYEAARRIDSHGCLAVMVGRCEGWRRGQWCSRSGCIRHCPCHSAHPSPRMHMQPSNRLLAACPAPGAPSSSPGSSRRSRRGGSWLPPPASVWAFTAAWSPT